MCKPQRNYGPVSLLSSDTSTEPVRVGYPAFRDQGRAGHRQTSHPCHLHRAMLVDVAQQPTPPVPLVRARLKGLEPIIWAVLGLQATSRRWYLFQCTVVDRMGIEPVTSIFVRGALRPLSYRGRPNSSTALSGRALLKP